MLVLQGLDATRFLKLRQVNVFLSEFLDIHYLFKRFTFEIFTLHLKHHIFLVLRRV